MRRISLKYIQWPATALLFALVYVLYTGPVMQQPDRFVIGRLDMQSDVPVFYNNIYLFKKKVQAGQNPLHNDMQMYPAGYNMAMNSHNFIMGIFCLPFNDISTGLNVGLWLSFILSGLGAALLCYRFVPNFWAALLAGFIFAFSPWKMIKLQDHHWFALTAAMPFYIYHFLDVFEYERNKYLPSIASYKKLVYCLLLGVVTALSEYYLTFFLLYFSAFYVLFKQYFQPWKINFRSWKTWGIIAVAVVAVSTLISLLDKNGWDNKGAFFWGGDLGGYLLPVYKTWVTDCLSYFGFAIPAYQENYFFLGFAFMVLVIVVFFFARKKHIQAPDSIKTFAWLSVVFVMLSLPVLKVLGHFTFYLPTAIIHYIPFVNNVRVITRVFILFSLVFPIVILWCYNAVFKKGYKNIFLALVLVILFFEFKPKPYQTIDKYYITDDVFILRDTKGDVVLSIPTGLRDGFTQTGFNNSDMLYFQPIFDKKIIGGYTARLSDKVRELYLSDSVMSTILLLSEKPDTVVAKPTSEEIKKFYSIFHPDIIFIHPKYRNTEAEKYIRQIATYKNLIPVESEAYLILATPGAEK